MMWQEVKDKIYYQDGSFRDIYIKDATRKDWHRWADFVNKNYKVIFTINEGDRTTDQIEFNKVLDYWDGKIDSPILATVLVGDIKVNTHFFIDEEIESDITPTEINSLIDHDLLIDYLKRVSYALDKKVILTPENESRTVLGSVEGDKVLLHALNLYR